MELSTLFKSLHGALDFNQLKPILSIAKEGTDLTPENVAETCKYLDIDPAKVFQDNSNVLDPYAYIDGPIYIPLTGFGNIEMMKVMRTQDRIKKMKQHFEELIKSNDYTRVFMMMDKKLLIPMYIKLFDVIPENQRYNIFSDLYTRSEYGFEQFTPEFLKRVFQLRFESDEWKLRMKEFDADSKKDSKGLITVYHGNNPNHDPKDEMSWTLKRDIAVFFANRFGAKGKIYHKKIKRDQVLDYFTNRNESEVLLMT